MLVVTAVLLSAVMAIGTHHLARVHVSCASISVMRIVLPRLTACVKIQASKRALQRREEQSQRQQEERQRVGGFSHRA
jgi:membrane protein implicated in regulation of membrane protease activity